MEVILIAFGRNQSANDFYLKSRTDTRRHIRIEVFIRCLALEFMKIQIYCKEMPKHTEDFVVRDQFGLSQKF